MKKPHCAILVLLFSASFLYGQAEGNKKTDIERLQLHESFEDFIWDMNSNDAGSDTVKMRAVLLDDSDKKLNGLEFGLSRKSGILLSVTPILVEKDKNQEIQIIVLWAFDGFQNGRITIDALWEIVRAVYPEKIGNDQILGVIANGLSTYEEKWIPIQRGGPVEKAVKTLKLEQFIKDDKIDLVGALLKSLHKKE